MPPRSALFDLELVEDRLRLRLAPLRLPLLSKPAIDLVETVVGIEDTAHDELRRDSAVPVVLLQAERDVVPSVTAVGVGPRSLTQSKRTTPIAAVALPAAPEMLPAPHRRQPPALAA